MFDQSTGMASNDADSIVIEMNFVPTFYNFLRKVKNRCRWTRVSYLLS